MTAQGATPRVGHADDEGPAAELFARVRAEAGGLPVVYRALGNAPALLQAWIGLGWTLRKEVEADRALCELLVLRVAQLTGSEYVWRSHYRMAIKEGVRQEQVDELAAWPSSRSFSEQERSALAMADQLTLAAEVDDDVWSRLAVGLADRQRVELVLTVSWYACVARAVAALGIPLEPHHARVPELPRLPSA